MSDSNDKVVETTEQVVNEIVHTENSQTTSSDDKTVGNDDIDFSVVDALPPQLNKDTGTETETEVLKSAEKGVKVKDKDDKKKDDKKSDALPFSQLFRYASPVDKLFIILGKISLRIYNY
jgi:hypothetical protein